MNRIPVVTAYRYLKTFGITMGDLEVISKDGPLVLKSSLRRFFDSTKSFKSFTDDMTVLDEEWAKALGENPRLARYIRKFYAGDPIYPPRSIRIRSRSPSPRGRLKRGRKKLALKAKLGRFTSGFMENEVPDDESYMVIHPSGDECDRYDVNLPKPVCASIRRVCRNYGPNKRYTKFKPDKSENNTYGFRVIHNIE